MTVGASDLQGAVHVWVVSPPTTIPGEMSSAYEALLSSEERQHLRDLARAEPRTEYLLTRALVRTTLSRYLDVHPQVWRFGQNRHGCPVIAYPAGHGLHFNVSHTRGLIVCAVVVDGDVGIDVEHRRRTVDVATVAATCLTPRESADVAACDVDGQSARFLAYWTVKEAYVKACREGLSRPLSEIEVAFGDGVAVTVTGSRRQDALGRGWTFARPIVSPDHVCALAVRARATAAHPARVVVRAVVPAATTLFSHSQAAS